MLNEFLQYVRKMADSPTLYVRGAQGQHGNEITDAWIAKREYNDAAQIARVKKRWDSLKASGAKDIYAFDCSGFIMYFLQNLKGLYTDRTANGIRTTLCDEISFDELLPGDIVFEMTDGSANHCGIFIGDNTTVECRGRDYGVVYASLTNRKWSKYGRLLALKNDIEYYKQLTDDITALTRIRQNLIDLRSDI